MDGDLKGLPAPDRSSRLGDCFDVDANEWDAMVDTWDGESRRKRVQGLLEPWCEDKRRQQHDETTEGERGRKAEEEKEEEG